MVLSLWLSELRADAWTLGETRPVLCVLCKKENRLCTFMQIMLTKSFWCLHCKFIAMFAMNSVWFKDFKIKSQLTTANKPVWNCVWQPFFKQMWLFIGNVFKSATSVTFIGLGFFFCSSLDVHKLYRTWKQ